MILINELSDAVVEGSVETAAARVTAGLETAIPAAGLSEEGLIAAMEQVGQLFEKGEIFVPDMMFSARAMNAALGLLKPRLEDQGVRAIGTVAIGTAQGDLHDIGKKLVAVMLKGSGYEIMDLGVDVSAEAPDAQVGHPWWPSRPDMSAAPESQSNRPITGVEHIEKP